MKKIALIVNKNKDKDLRVMHGVVDRLLSMNFEVYLKSELVNEFSGEKMINFSDNPYEQAELLIVIGGDGSVIDASNHAVKRDIPMLGINLGKVGYLSEVDPENLDVLKLLCEGKYSIEEKMLLSVDGIDDRFAVNDVVVTHESYLGIGEMRITDSGGNTVKYRADGVVISTPQGSTAYSLSAGGPVVAHDVDSILLTPVAPHSFFNRSVLFNASDELTVTNVGEDELNIAIDGRRVGGLNKKESCKIIKSDKRLKMLTFSKNCMFTSLFKKMRILEDIT